MEVPAADRSDVLSSTLGKLSGAKRTWQVLNVVLLVITLAGITGAAWFGLQWYNGARVGGTQTEPVDAARDGVTKFLTLAPSSVTEDLENVSEIAHGDFADEWAKGEKTLKQSVLKSGATLKPDILKAGYVKGDSDSATVMLIVDTRVSFKNKVDVSDEKKKKKDEDKKDEKKTDWDQNGDGIPDARNEHYRIKVEMALVEGTWKIAKLELAK